MPTATDLVTDLPADFEVFGQAVDTDFADLNGGTTGQVLSKTSATDLDFTWVSPQVGDITGVTAGNGISVTDPTGPVPTVAINTAITADLTTAQTLTNKTLTSPALTTPTISTATTNGDLLYGTGSGALSRIGIGSTAQVLTVAAGIPSWATPATPSSAKSYALLSTTATTSGTSFTVTGLSGYDILYVMFKNIRVTDSGNNQTKLQINSVTTGSNSYGGSVAPSSTFTTTAARTDSGAPFLLFNNGTVGAQDMNGYFFIQGANTSGVKIITQATTVNPNGGTNALGIIGTAHSNDSAVVSSLTISTTGTAFNNGAMYIYGAV